MRKGIWIPDSGGCRWLSATDFPQTKQILLQENYRSTAAILSASIAIVAQGAYIETALYYSYLTPSLLTDKARPQKTLYTSHPRGTIPVIKTCDNEHAEADFIAREIKRLKANMGGVLQYGDFCILCMSRFSRFVLLILIHRQWGSTPCLAW